MKQNIVRLCTKITLITAVIGSGLFHIVFAQFATDEHLSEGLGVARFTSSDELIFPADTDRWVVLGTNIGGDYSDAEFNPKDPGNIGVVQMEPNAYIYLLENGEYADGTMLLLSFYETQEKCYGPSQCCTLLCSPQKYTNRDIRMYRSRDQEDA